MGSNGIELPCYGIKLTVTKPVSVNGKTYVPGMKLTVDAHMHLIEVSGW